MYLYRIGSTSQLKKNNQLVQSKGCVTWLFGWLKERRGGGGGDVEARTLNFLLLWGVCV